MEKREKTLTNLCIAKCKKQDMNQQDIICGEKGRVKVKWNFRLVES